MSRAMGRVYTVTKQLIFLCLTIISILIIIIIFIWFQDLSTINYSFYTTCNNKFKIIPVKVMLTPLSIMCCSTNWCLGLQTIIMALDLCVPN